MRKLILLTITILTCINMQAVNLSDQAKIYVLTCSPGTELYSVFGHSAIRVYDPEQDIDVVFNYGTFDFNTEHFYLKYAQGLLPYQLSISSYDHFLYSYMLDNRSVFSQELLLDSIDRQNLYQTLIENYKPENRSYLYNFLYDNCSTRIRDILNTTIRSGIQWKIAEQDKSFWNLLDEYLIRMQWVKWGIHTILALPGNHKADPYQYMFLPDYLMEGIDKAYTPTGKLAASPVTLFQQEEIPIHNPWYFSPFLVFLLATILIITIIEFFKSPKVLNTIGALLFTVTGLLGCLFIFLGYFTEHPMTAPNLNIVFGNPLNLFIVPFILLKRVPHIIRIYLRIYMIILIIGIPAWFVCMPAVPLASMSLVILMLYISYKFYMKIGYNRF